MFMSFIAGLIFGVGSGYVEKSIAAPLRNQFDLSDSELGIISFAGLLLIASILISAMGVNTSAFWMVLGGGIGAFGIRAYIFGKAEMDKRRIATQSTASDLAEDAADAVADAKDSVSSSVKDLADDMKDAASKVKEKV